MGRLIDLAKAAARDPMPSDPDLPGVSPELAARLSAEALEDIPTDLSTVRASKDDITLWWRIAIQEPGGRTVEVDAPSGDTLQGWQAYATRYHGPGCTVTAIALLPKPRAPVKLDEALAAACEGVAGITVQVFRSLLSPEDVADIEAGDIHRKTIHAYAQSFAEGIQL